MPTTNNGDSNMTYAEAQNTVRYHFPEITVASYGYNQFVFHVSRGAGFVGFWCSGTWYDGDHNKVDSLLSLAPAYRAALLSRLPKKEAMRPVDRAWVFAPIHK
jgi:hypothetical protein